MPPRAPPIADQLAPGDAAAAAAAAAAAGVGAVILAVGVCVLETDTVKLDDGGNALQVNAVVMDGPTAVTLRFRYQGKNVSSQVPPCFSENCHVATPLFHRPERRALFTQFEKEKGVVTPEWPSSLFPGSIGFAMRRNDGGTPRAAISLMDEFADQQPPATDRINILS